MLRKILFLFFILYTFSASATETPKYVFMFIGDGMAMPQISSAESYSYALEGKGTGVERLSFTKYPYLGVMTTYDAGSLITDSASAVTAMTTGNKTLNGVINMDPGKKEHYVPFTYKLKEIGYKIGIISTVSLDHATPAGYYASVPSRGNMYNIGLQLAESGFDFFGGGGFVQRNGKEKDKKDLYDIFKERGFTVVTTKSAFTKLSPSAAKVVAINEVLQDASAMPYDLDRASADLSLADYTQKAIELLENKKGFFLMIEGGKVDWACHANDAAAAIHDTLALDKAVQVAFKFYQKYPNDTLIIVTGDHETGGMGIGFAGTQYATFFDKVSKQKGSYIKFNSNILEPYKKSNPKGSLADLYVNIKDYFGYDVTSLTKDEQAQLELAFKNSMGSALENTSNEMLYLLYGGYEPLTVKLTQIMNQKAGIGWTSYAHTGVPVPVFAIGKGAQVFNGYYDNTDIFFKTVKILDIKGYDKKVVSK